MQIRYAEHPSTSKTLAKSSDQIYRSISGILEYTSKSQNQRQQTLVDEIVMAPALPDEILLNIIKAAVEPYSLSLRGRLGRFEDFEEDEWELFSTSLDLNHLFTGWPKVKSLMLVNKMFFKEVMTLVEQRFTGTLIIDESSVFTLTRYLDNNPNWRIHPNIIHLCVTEYVPFYGGLNLLLPEEPSRICNRLFWW